MYSLAFWDDIVALHISLVYKLSQKKFFKLSTRKLLQEQISKMEQDVINHAECLAAIIGKAQTADLLNALTATESEKGFTKRQEQLLIGFWKKYAETVPSLKFVKAQNVKYALLETALDTFMTMRKTLEEAQMAEATIYFINITIRFAILDNKENYRGLAIIKLFIDALGRPLHNESKPLTPTA